MNLQSRTTLKENRKSRVLKYLISFILSITIGIAAAVTVAAYTETTDDELYTHYSFDNLSVSGVRPMIVGDIPPSFTPTMSFRVTKANVASFSYYNADESTFSDSSKRIGSVQVGQGYPNRLNLLSGGTTNYIASTDSFISNVAVVSLVENFLTPIELSNSKINITFDFSTLSYFKTSFSSVNEIDFTNQFVSEMKLYFIRDNSIVLTLEPTSYSTTSGSVRALISDDFGANNIEGEIYPYQKTIVEYLVDFQADSFSFDAIQVSLPVSCGTTYTSDNISPLYYWTQVVGYNFPELAFISESVFNDKLIANYQNTQLINSLSTVNVVDQARINAQNSSYSEVSTVTGNLSGMTDFSESLVSQVDLSQEVDVLSDGALIDSVNNMWDLFPWDSPFMTTAIGMVGSIALLSLVLHGGERALFGKSSGGRSKSSKKGDDS